MKSIFIIKHDEFATKGFLYPKLEEMLVKDIKNIIQNKGIKATIKKERGRIYVEGEDKVKSILTNIFGIAKVGKGYEFKDYEELKNNISKLVGDKKYKVEVKRSNKKFPKTSIEIAKEIASILDKEGKKTSVRDYDEILRVEIRENKVILIIKEEKGLGGFPYGFGGKAILLFSAGFDSTLVLFLARKQGINPILVSIIPSSEIKNKIEKVLKRLKEKYFIKAKIKYIQLPKNLFEIDEKLRQIAFKRFLYKAAEKYAKKNRAYAIITGEVIGQTHTQRLSNINLLQKGIDTPFIRPLAFYSKNEIINKIREIGLYELVEKIPEFCSLSKKVKTILNYKDMEKIESQINEMVENMEEFEEEVEEEYEKNAIILDIENKKDLEAVLNHNLKKDLNYILVCKSGSTAKFLAKELRRHGFKAVGKAKEEVKK